MPQAPIKIRDRRSSSGYTNSYPVSGGRMNTLIQAATQSPERRRILMLDRDTHRSVSNFGRRTLMTLGRWLFWNIPAVRGAVLEQANLSISTFIPQFYGTDAAYGKQAEAWLTEWDKICDVSGWPYDGNTMRSQMVVQSIVDGELFILLTQNEQGYPQIQVHPAHRIGSDYAATQVTDGPFDGYQIFDGVIVNEIGRIVGYRYIGDSYNFGAHIDISSDNLFPVFFPEYSDMYRGFSGLASCVFDFQDVQETRGFEKFAQKINSTIALIEKNETGEPDGAKAMIQAGTTARDAATGNLGSLYQETLDGGMIRYLRAGSGAGLESVRHDRPTEAQQSFEERIVRSAMAGMEWSADFSLDPSKVGGAPFRVIVDKICRVLAKKERMVAKAQTRIHGYASVKANRLGLLPDSSEWYKIKYQGPADLTADKKYQSDVDLQEYRAGWTTLDDITARRGLFWEDVQDQRIAERVRLETECKKVGIDPDKIELLTANPPAPPPQDNPTEKP